MDINVSDWFILFAERTAIVKLNSLHDKGGGYLETLHSEGGAYLGLNYKQHFPKEKKRKFTLNRVVLQLSVFLFLTLYFGVFFFCNFNLNNTFFKIY